MDEIDKKILEMLQKDARISYTDLAKKLSLSDVGVKKRIEKLINNDVIKGFSVNLNHKKIGKELHAFLLLKTIPAERENLIKELRKIENVASISATIGPYDAVIEVLCTNIDELKKITENSMANIRGITEIRTLVVI
jgi:DNA-binding Lrp family transcriptional regulator